MTSIIVLVILWLILSQIQKGLASKSYESYNKIMKFSEERKALMEERQKEINEKSRQRHEEMMRIGVHAHFQSRLPSHNKHLAQSDKKHLIIMQAEEENEKRLRDEMLRKHLWGHSEEKE
jgi:hypothetical protein